MAPGTAILADGLLATMGWMRLKRDDVWTNHVVKRRMLKRQRPLSLHLV
jgi:hypothetical protein